MKPLNCPFCPMTFYDSELYVAHMRDEQARGSVRNRLWRGECGHHWLKSESDPCPVCRCQMMTNDEREQEDAPDAISRLRDEIISLQFEIKLFQKEVEFWKDGHHAANEEIQRCITALSELMYVGNRLARGEATAEEWHEAVSRAIPENVKPIACKRENDDDLSGT